MTESAGRPAASVIRVEGGHVEADVCDTGKCLTENYPKKYQMAHPSKEIVTVKKRLKSADVGQRNNDLGWATLLFQKKWSQYFKKKGKKSIFELTTGRYCFFFSAASSLSS